MLLVLTSFIVAPRHPWDHGDRWPRWSNKTMARTRWAQRTIDPWCHCSEKWNHASGDNVYDCRCSLCVLGGQRHELWSAIASYRMKFHKVYHFATVSHPTASFQSSVQQTPAHTYKYVCIHYPSAIDKAMPFRLSERR